MYDSLPSFLAANSLHQYSIENIQNNMCKTNLLKSVLLKYFLLFLFVAVFTACIPFLKFLTEYQKTKFELLERQSESFSTAYKIAVYVKTKNKLPSVDELDELNLRRKNHKRTFGWTITEFDKNLLVLRLHGAFHLSFTLSFSYDFASKELNITDYFTF